MPRLIQTLAFFTLVGAGLLASTPHSDGAELLGVVLGGSIVSATIAYVLPWVFLDLDVEPAATTEEP